MSPRTAPTTTGALVRLLAGSLFALLLGACGDALGAEGSITFRPAEFAEGDTVTLHYAGVNADVPIQLLHDEAMVGRTRTVRDLLGTTSGKSGSITFTAPAVGYAYRVEIREPCTEPRLRRSGQVHRQWQRHGNVRVDRDQGGQVLVHLHRQRREALELDDVRDHGELALTTLLASKRFVVRDGVKYDHSGQYQAFGFFAYAGP